MTDVTISDILNSNHVIMKVKWKDPQTNEFITAHVYVAADMTDIPDPNTKISEGIRNRAISAARDLVVRFHRLTEDEI